MNRRLFGISTGSTMIRKEHVRRLTRDYFLAWTIAFVLIYPPITSCSLFRSRRAMTERKLNIHGWVYDMYSGEIRIVKSTATGKAGSETTAGKEQGAQL